MTNERLIKIFTEIKDEKQMEKFFLEIFTEKELIDLSLRWRLLADLHKNKTQREIAKKYHISLCKITRGSKILKKKNSIIKKILDNKET
ncbi:MAG: Trp family transcriptional regulator [Candidatus Marinimicrobia bacterium]|nr:Trp family transcriptional regulator [Candidatus Neomarinimicrobiota bacterium]